MAETTLAKNQPKNPLPAYVVGFLPKTRLFNFANPPAPLAACGMVGLLAWLVALARGPHFRSPCQHCSACSLH